MAENNNSGFLENLTPAQRAKAISVVDELRRKHYGDLRMTRRDRALTNKVFAFMRGEGSESEAKEFFGDEWESVKAIRERWKAFNIHKVDRAVMNHIALLVDGILLMNGDDDEAGNMEYEAVFYELKKQLANLKTCTDDNAPVRVEIADGSVRKLADATGRSVKKAIKPGKGAANERYAFKDELMGIWKKYRDDGTLKESLNHKVYHRDVFDYPPAKKEIVALRKDPPIEFEEFNRALGAYSDRKHRRSPAKRNKPQ